MNTHEHTFIFISKYTPETKHSKPLDDGDLSKCKNPPGSSDWRPSYLTLKNTTFNLSWVHFDISNPLNQLYLLFFHP